MVDSTRRTGLSWVLCVNFGRVRVSLRADVILAWLRFDGVWVFCREKRQSNLYESDAPI